MNKLIIEPSPHIRSNNSTQKIMLNVIIALLPSLAAAIYFFGPRAFALTAACVASCVAFEFIFKKIVKRDRTIDDFSAIVTGIILALNLPVTLPYYMAVIGCFIAIIIIKQMFGGIGQNFANPAITARIVLTLSFSAQMSRWAEPFYYNSMPFNIGSVQDVVTQATPLALKTDGSVPNLVDMFWGIHGGSMGETCSLAILIGFAYLLITRVITPVTPFAFVGTVALGAFLSGGDAVFEVLAGGLLFGAVFMATDYSTTPITLSGKLIFGIGCGAITLIIRNFGGMPDGVSFSILIMNILTPYIDRATRTRPFGYKKEKLKG